jgi:hypothetical protein
MGTINHYAKPLTEKDEDSYKKKFDFTFSMIVHKSCVLHADTQEEADEMARKLFDTGEDYKDWNVDVGEIYDKEVTE